MIRSHGRSRARKAKSFISILRRPDALMLGVFVGCAALGVVIAVFLLQLVGKIILFFLEDSGTALANIGRR